jgi:hypothetical protein
VADTDPLLTCPNCGSGRFPETPHRCTRLERRSYERRVLAPTPDAHAHVWVTTFGTGPDWWEHCASCPAERPAPTTDALREAAADALHALENVLTPRQRSHVAEATKALRAALNAQEADG